MKEFDFVIRTPKEPYRRHIVRATSLRELLPEEKDQLLAVLKEADRLCAEENKRLRDEFNVMIGCMRKIYKSYAIKKIEAYLEKTFNSDSERWYTDHVSSFNRRLELELEEQKKIQKEEEKTKKEAERAVLIAEAILWLKERGKQLGIDFEPSEAVDYANTLAYHQEVERRMKEMREEKYLIEFSGDDNCEGCGGWNGESRRCECGNRRVSWEEEYGHSFKDPHVIAVAY